MQDLLWQPHFLLPIGVYSITLLNGDRQIFSAFSFIVNIVTILIPLPISLANAKELFNLRHASAHNIIERMFGILKNQFAILQHNPHLKPEIQAHLPAALAAIHNVIRTYDNNELQSCLDELETPEYDVDDLDEEDTEGELVEGPPKQAEKKDAERRRDEMAEVML
jgi:hypothetical protein